jgi:Leucine-rich repeat (LRR) protein
MTHLNKEAKEKVFTYLEFLIRFNLSDVRTETEFITDLAKIKKLTVSDLENLIYLIYANRWPIETLNLSEKGLSVLPDNLHLLQSVKTLNLSNNSLSTLPDSIWQMGNLVNLNLQGNRFTTIKVPNINSSLNIKTLNLSRNLFTEYPETINSHLPQLETLNLSFNRLTFLPQFIHLTKLTHLFLNENRLEKIDPDLFKMKELDIVDLSYNHIKEIDHATILQHLRKQGRKMKFLNVEYNWLAIVGGKSLGVYIEEYKNYEMRSPLNPFNWW